MREALTLMIQNDYSQLPVVDENGELFGLISYETISRRYFHSSALVPLLDLKVNHCLDPAVTLPRDADIFEALDRLQDAYAVVITEENKPVGILTDYDMAHFFRDLTGDLLIVENIETSLRQIAQVVLSDDEAMEAALIASFGKDKGRPGEPRRPFDRLSFGELMHLIMHPANWQSFDAILAPLELFRQYMDQVRQHRNQLTHFRGRLDAVQHDLVEAAQHWLETRPNLPDYRTVHVPETAVRAAVPVQPRAGRSKYDLLCAFLKEARDLGETRISMEFEDIEQLIGTDLPESASMHRAWWGNHYGNIQARAWLSAGWLVDDVELSMKRVSFRQSRSAYYPLFFDQLLTGLKAHRPGIASGSKVSMGNWYSFSAGTPGYTFGWVLPKEPVLRVELYIDIGREAENKAAFDSLLAQRETIEDKIGALVDWDRLDARRASRISISTPFDIADPEADYQRAVEWGIEMMLKFIDIFQPRLRKP